MGLTIGQQLKLKNGDIGPAEYTLFDLVAQISFQHAQWWYNTHKAFSPDYHLAASYQLKKYNVCQRVISGDSGLYRTLLNLVVVLLGNTEDFDNMQAPEYDWETKVLNVTPRAFELAANIQRPELDEYNDVTAE